jgi:hypothetical protein
MRDRLPWQRADSGVMNKISSNSTGFYKRVFPAMWFGFIAVFVGVALLSGAARETNGAFLLGPCLMAVFGYFIMKRFIWDLMDEVYDCGDYLLVRNRGMEENVALSNIMNVSMSIGANPPRLELRLVKPGRFGTEIVFSPTRPFSFNPFARNPVAEDLMVRVDRARSKRAG